MLIPGTCFPGRVFLFCHGKGGLQDFYNNFESISHSDILLRSLSLTIHPCIIISLASQAETVWGFIFCFCKFRCVLKVVFPLSIIYNIILWERDEDRESLAILVFYANSQHTSEVIDSKSSWGDCSSAKTNWNTNEAKLTASATTYISVNSPASLPSPASLQENKPQMTEAGVIKGVYLFCRDRLTPPEATHTYFYIQILTGLAKLNPKLL